MWKKKFVFILNYIKTFKTVHKNNPRMHSPQQNKKAVLTKAAYLKVSSRKVAGTIIVLLLPSFTKKGVSGIKLEKWTPLLNFANSN